MPFKEEEGVGMKPLKGEEGGNIADITVLWGLVNFPRGPFFGYVL